MKQKNRLFASAFLTGGFLLVSVTVPAVQQKHTGKQQQLDLQLFGAVQAGQVKSVQSLLNWGCKSERKNLKRLYSLAGSRLRTKEHMSENPVGVSSRRRTAL